MLAFGLSTVVIAIWLRTSSSDRPLATSFAGSTWIRTDGFCWPPIETCATPEIWLICCASWASTASLTVVSGSVSDVAAGGGGRCLPVVGGAVDIAVEVELNRHRRGSQITRRGHLGHAGNLRQLALQRLRHRGGHGFGAAARQAGGDLNGWKVNLRQRRHRQQRIGNEADKQDARHHQRSADGVANEGGGNAVAHSCLTLVCAGSELA